MTRAEILQVAKPILFNTDMVKAILEGRKTVTRRCVKPKSKNASGFYVTFRKSDNAFMGVYDYDENERQFDDSQTPPACVGDILYVRETWNWYPIEMCSRESYIYRADFTYEKAGYVTWKPSLHMPKEAARIFLKVKDVSVERLNDMRLEDFLNEGIMVLPEAFNDPENAYWQAKDTFSYLWNSTIKKENIETYGWDANPWVWVIEFEWIELDCEV